MLLSELNQKTATCWECKGKPDEVYFRSEDGKEGEVLSVICHDCKTAFEATIRSIGRMFGATADGDSKDVE